MKWGLVFGGLALGVGGVIWILKSVAWDFSDEPQLADLDRLPTPIRPRRDVPSVWDHDHWITDGEESEEARRRNALSARGHEG